MKTWQCDNCGRITRAKPRRASIQKLQNVDHWEGFWTIYGKDIDLCPTCAKAARQAIKEALRKEVRR